ncbi:MAG: hypothetical protein HeimC2_22590 [Candidatus Heimdallarchaeota archaeon LC_2]|nr:MAG: hypothetical protein HeimC2_22590 [Candidatus Heimdallarchaeota archaeon LC_2]
MKLHIYTDGMELENEPISLQQAFELLEKQSDHSMVEDNFIGFTIDNDDKAIIQFIRFNEKKWTIDIPAYEEMRYIGALTNQVSHDLVFSITRDFFDTNSLFHKSIKLKKYENITEYMKTRYGVIFEFEVKEY